MLRHGRIAARLRRRQVAVGAVAERGAQHDDGRGSPIAIAAAAAGLLAASALASAGWGLRPRPGRVACARRHTGITTPARSPEDAMARRRGDLSVRSTDAAEDDGGRGPARDSPGAGRGGGRRRRSDLSGHVPRHARRRTRPAAHLPWRVGHRRRGADPALEADRRVARPDGRAGGAVEGRRAEGPPGSLQGGRHRDHQHDDRRLQRRDLGRAEGGGADRQRRRVDQGRREARAAGDRIQLLRAPPHRGLQARGRPRRRRLHGLRLHAVEGPAAARRRRHAHAGAAARTCRPLPQDDRPGGGEGQRPPGPASRTIRRCRCRAAPSRSWPPSSTGRRTWIW